MQPGGPPEALVSLRAISVKHEQKRMAVDMKQLSEQMVLAEMEWRDEVERIGESGIRDHILRSICPEVNGLYPVKLAVALAISSGGIDNTTAMACGLNKRGQSHLLLIGDPGLAKSKLLLSAASFAPRAVQTTGMGCSTAGLTAAAVKEDGEWQLEAGALVLADGGICCIDEFNLMRENDKASIHEAMEQQTISMAKAGMVCKLTTRCAILAAANPKNLYSMSEPEGPSSINIGIASPLLSRFDLVFVLRDERNMEWDDKVADHLIKPVSAEGNERRFQDTSLWSNERLQSHFVATRNIHPSISEEANLILGAYYKSCRNDPQRDPARSTVRLLDSLNRLAQAYTRLLFRHTVNVSDAALIVRLMESTHGFGRVLPPFDIIKEQLPLGPEEEDVADVYRILKLGEYVPRVHTDSGSSKSSSQSTKRTWEEAPSKSLENPSPSNLSDRDLDEILNFDLSGRAKTEERDEIGTEEPNDELETTPADDEDDFILSQALDHIESSQLTNEAAAAPENPKLDLQQFAFSEKSKMTLKRSQMSSFNRKCDSFIRSQLSSAATSSGTVLNMSASPKLPSAAPLKLGNSLKRNLETLESNQAAKKNVSKSTLIKLSSFEKSKQDSDNESRSGSTSLNDDRPPTIITQLEDYDNLDFLEL